MSADYWCENCNKDSSNCKCDHEDQDWVRYSPDEKFQTEWSRYATKSLM